MSIRDQLAILVELGVRHVVVGGQAAMLRLAIDFSKDLDILILPDEANAERVRDAVRIMTTLEPDVATILGRDFQQYVHPASGVELDVHLKLIAIPTFETALRNASRVDYLGVEVDCLELPALYASKRTDRPKDAVHRLAIEDRLRELVRARDVEPTEIVLACSLDEELARLPEVAGALPEMARRTAQPLLQIRILAHAPRLAGIVGSNAALHATTKSLLGLAEETRIKLLGAPARLAALLAKTPLFLPDQGARIE